MHAADRQIGTEHGPHHLVLRHRLHSLAIQAFYQVSLRIVLVDQLHVFVFNTALRLPNTPCDTKTWQSC
jgi:hypothetical protein